MGQSTEPYPIEILEKIVNSASSIETIAVWRIKFTNMPLWKRLHNRVLFEAPYYANKKL